MATPVTIRIQSADFDIAAEIAALTKGNADIGAVVGSQLCACRDADQCRSQNTDRHRPGQSAQGAAWPPVLNCPHPLSKRARGAIAQHVRGTSDTVSIPPLASESAGPATLACS